jgi:menaquinone-9 beta-reductase
MRADWDAIVVGGSFAGLAAAGELAGAGRVLLVDKDAIGDGQTSACATPVAVLERLGARDTIEQVHEEIVFHLPGGGVHPYRPAYAFATFDYRAFCELMARHSDATVLKAWARGIEGDRVVTSEGTFHAPIVIDASGWRCALGTSVRPGQVKVEARSVGLEARLPRTGSGLHFWIGDALARDGYLWDFPAGDHSRVGLLRYRSGGGLKPRLNQFAETEVVPEQLHGGVLPSRLRAPVAGRVFLAGDAAGQCLPLSGEGIRPALVYGQLAGRLACEVLEGRRTLGDALAAYRRAALRPRLKYRLLAAIERALPHMPGAVMEVMTWYFGAGPLAHPCQGVYWRIAPAEALRATLTATMPA